MATVQQWGRKESVIWPPRGYVYTLGAFIFACILAGLFIYIRFQYGLSPLQRYYLPYYLRTETAGLTHPVSQYQLLYVSDGEKQGRAALDRDVQPGSTPQFGGKSLPLMLTPEAARHGTSYLMRESLRNYQNRALHAWIARWIYQVCRFISSSRCSSSLASLPSRCSYHFQFVRTYGESRIFVMGGV